MTDSDIAARAPKPSRIPREIWVLVSAAFVIALGFGLVAPVLPQFARSFDVGVTAASVIVSVFAFVRLLFAPASGRLVQWFGEQPIYLAGLLIVSVSTGACAFAQSYWQLLIFRGLGGVGSTMFTVSAMGLILRLAPSDVRGRVSGLYASAFLIGSVGGPIVGGLLAGFGLRVPFLVYAGALLVAVAVVYSQLRGSALAGRPNSAGNPSMSAREAWSHPAFRAALASSFANGWSSFGVRVALIPMYAAAALGAGPATAGAGLAAFAAGNAVALIPSGRFADVHGRKPGVLAGLTVTGLATIALGFTTSTFAFMVASVVAGIGAGLLNPPQQAAVADVIGAGRSGGPVLASFQMMADVGAITGPILGGLLVEQFSYAAAFTVTGAISLCAALVWLAAPETLREPKRD